MHSELGPGPGEPSAEPWGERVFDEWLTALLTGRGDRIPLIIGIDGRGGSGKSTLASRIRTSLAGHGTLVEIVSTDDIAWHHSILSWHPLLVEHVLEPLRRGESVSYRPDAWIERGREGSIQVSSNAQVLVVEGTGTLHESVLPFLDRGIWVQSDYELARERALDRDVASGVNGDRNSASKFWEHWQREEVPYLTAHQPWLRADAIVCGVSREIVPNTSILVASAPAVS